MPCHVSTDPAILYVGTPVVLLSTLNTDGSANLAPISSAFRLGDRCVLGLSPASHTWANLQSQGELVVALPSVEQAEAVDQLALTTGAQPVPTNKMARGYRHVRDKFAAAGLTPVASQVVSAPRVAECPIAMEIRVTSMTHENGGAPVVEGRVEKVHAHPDILICGRPNRVDPDKWRPLFMSFQKFYGLTEQVQPSRLATIDEEQYRS